MRAVISQLQFPGMEGPSAPPGGPQQERVAPTSLTPAQRRLQANRDRITFKGNPRTPASEDVLGVERYGLQRASAEQRSAATPLVPVNPRFSTPDTTRQFQKFGETRYVPLVGDNAVRIGQEAVNPRRVSQLRQDPEMGKDPRFPADHASQMPHVLEVPASRRDRSKTVGVLMQGTHRAAADIANGRLFTEARVIPRSRALDAKNDRVEHEEEPLNVQRATFKEETAHWRWRTGNPTLKGPIDL